MDEQKKDEIRDLVARAKLDKALEMFSNWAELRGDKDLKNALFMKKGEWADLRKDENLGMIGGNDANIRRNRIAGAILSMLDDAEEAIKMPSNVHIVSEKEVITSNGLGKIQSNTQKTILFMGANPPGTDKVQIEVEHSRISTELKNRFNLEVAKFLSATEIPKLITAKRPQIIHFSGHGQDPETGEHGASNGGTRAIGKASDFAKKGGIVVYDNTMRQLKIIEDNQLEYVFKTVINVFKIPIEVALFNSCYSESQAKVLGKYIPYVIGTSRAIKDEIAIAFAVGFYYGIADGQTIEESFFQGKMQAVLEDSAAETLIVMYKNGELQSM